MIGQTPGADGTPGSYNHEVNTGLELYNLTDDVAEQHNAAMEHPEMVDRLTKLANFKRKQLGDTLTNQPAPNCESLVASTSNHWREMLRQSIEQRHIDLDSGRSCLALDVNTGKHLKCWPMKTAGTIGVRSSIYVPRRPQDMPLASFVRQSITRYLFREYDWRRSVP